MRLSDMLLYYSFSQIKGVSDRKEAALWSKGDISILNNEDMLSSQQSLFNEEHDDTAYMSIQAMKHGDADYFAKNLTRKNYYRIAYSFPDDVMFLDIETTGLSTVYHYVTMIGWIINGVYHYWLQGTDPTPFLNAFESAKMIVTFNGIKFDCKFLDFNFSSSSFSSKPNLDLMYLCRRFNLTGGQKEIEKALGFNRPDDLLETNGKEAVALWYSFLFGENKSASKLISYNYYDVTGMTYILDWIFFRCIYGKIFPRRGRPHPFCANVTDMNQSACALSVDECNSIRQYIKNNISNFSREKLLSSYPFRIVGIDLAGKKTSRTGLCLLVGNHATTSVAHTDDEIAEFIREQQPNLISIDAPLSLPKGRTNVYDDDPARLSGGITRYSERVLKRRNVNCYPALIRSMQELTKRGIKLSEEFRACGYPVIECFPGAAQDVIQLPRKRTDENLLKSGLSEFGVVGDFLTKSVYHDELDAITAALVGQFFISEFYEPLGIPEENDMIIPQKEKRPPYHHLVIGLVGPVATGKTVAGRYLEKYGFHYIRYSQIIAQNLTASGNSANRNDLRQEGWNLYSGRHQYHLNEKMFYALHDYPFVVIDGMRHYEDYTFWKEKSFLRFLLVYINTDYTIRKVRFESRSDDFISYEKAVNHPVEEQVELLREKADFMISNNHSLEGLYEQLDSLISDVKKRERTISSVNNLEDI